MYTNGKLHLLYIYVYRFSKGFRLAIFFHTFYGLYQNILNVFLKDPKYLFRKPQNASPNLITLAMVMHGVLRFITLRSLFSSPMSKKSLCFVLFFYLTNPLYVYVHCICAVVGDLRRLAANT